MNRLYGRWNHYDPRINNRAELWESVGTGIIHIKNEWPDNNIAIYIGTDSNKNCPFVVFSSAIIVHAVGRGAQLYYLNGLEPQYRPSKEDTKERFSAVRRRLIRECEISIQIAWELEDTFVEHGIEYQKALIVPMLNADSNCSRVEIHADINRVEEFLSAKVVDEAVGLVEGQGFYVNPKPDSFAATNIADALTRKFNWRKFVRKRKGRWEIMI